MVEAIARLCYPGAVEVGFDAGPEASVQQTMAFMNAHDAVTIVEANLIFERRLARADILKRDGNKFELIEVKSKSVDTSTGLNPLHGAHGRILAPWGALS